MSFGFPPFARLVAAALTLVVLTGCQAGIRVAVELGKEARGQVRVTATLDDAAAERIGDLAEFVDDTGLAASGWLVEAGEQQAVATRSVNGPADVEAALRDLTGAGGPFSGLRFRRNAGFLRTVTGVSGRVDLSRGLATFGDDGLTQLTGSPTGVDAPASILSLSLEVDLPGDESGNAPGGGAIWELPLGQVTEIRAESTMPNFAGIGGVAVAVAAALGLIVAGVRRRR